jgi:hypothetical protein
MALIGAAGAATLRIISVMEKLQLSAKSNQSQNAGGLNALTAKRSKAEPPAT